MKKKVSDRILKNVWKRSNIKHSVLITLILRIKYHRGRVGKEYRDCLKFRWFACWQASRQVSGCFQVGESMNRQFLRVIKVHLPHLCTLPHPLCAGHLHLAMTPTAFPLYPCRSFLLFLYLPSLAHSCTPSLSLSVSSLYPPPPWQQPLICLPACLNASHLLLSDFCFILYWLACRKPAGSCLG